MISMSCASHQILSIGIWVRITGMNLVWYNLLTSEIFCYLFANSIYKEQDVIYKYNGREHIHGDTNKSSMSVNQL